MVEEDKVTIFMTSGPDTPQRCAAPFYIANMAVAMDNQAEMALQIDGTLEIGFTDVAQKMVGSVILLYSEKSRKGYIKR